MAQTFSLRRSDLETDLPRAALGDALAALPQEWTLLRDRSLDDQDGPPVGFVLTHGRIGVALVDIAPADPSTAIGAFRAFLERERFAEFFPGELPVAALSVNPEAIDEIGDRLAAAFAALPPLTIEEQDWADAVIELLLTPSDLSMTPIAGAAKPAETETPELEPAAFLVPPRPSPVEAAPQPDYAAPRVPPPILALQDEPPERLYPSPAPRRHFGSAVALAFAAMAMGGLVVMVWGIEGGETPPPPSVGPASEVVVPLEPPPVPAPLAAPPVVTTEREAPPPVPPGPPVTTGPKRTLPPPIPRAISRAAPPPVAPATENPVPPPAAPAPPPAAPPSAAVATAKPPLPAPWGNDADTTHRPAARRPAAQSPAPAPPAPAPRETAPRETARSDTVTAPAATPDSTSRPPLDATDLPPLPDDPLLAPPPAAGSSAPPAQEALAPTTPAPAPPTALGPPRSILTPAPANPAPAADPPPQARTSTTAPASDRECRVYTAETTLLGNKAPVHGLACRGPDGHWHLVSEVPAQQR